MIFVVRCFTRINRQYYCYRGRIYGKLTLSVLQCMSAGAGDNGGERLFIGNTHRGTFSDFSLSLANQIFDLTYNY